MPLRFSAALYAVSAVAALSCAEGTPGPAARPILVAVRAGAIDVDDSVPPGWRRVRVEEDGAGHIVVAFRLADTGAMADPERFLAALDTASMTPAGALALGGPEVGDTGEVVLDLRPGVHVFACVRRDREGRRHASLGEASVVVAAGEPEGVMPTATDTVSMTDFAYHLAADVTWPAGSRLLRVENAGAQDHQVRIVRLNPGASVREWLDAERKGSLAKDVAGMARLGPGGAAYLRLDLEPGVYLLTCLITDPRSGEPHVALGMFKPITVAVRE